jgi:hypothetical protein
LFAHLIAKATRTNRLAAATAAAVIFAGFAVRWFVAPMLQPETKVMTKLLEWQDLDPDLPIVTASGLTFLEMNKREDDELLSRVYYLTDREAAIKFAHATIFEGLHSAHRWFPIRARIMPYQDFTKDTPDFLVLCLLNYPEDWLVPKLMADGAELRFLGQIEPGYQTAMVFHVTYPSREPTEPEGVTGATHGEGEETINQVRSTIDATDDAQSRLALPAEPPRSVKNAN